MSNAFAASLDKNFNFDEKEPVINTIFQQYERVVVESLISSFALDFLIADLHGGDVDTIHNVRQIDNDPLMTYKNKANEQAYNQRGEYNSSSYHSHENYIKTNREAKQQKIAGTLKDEYTGKTFAKNDKINLDHVVSAKEIHDDRGRVLAGMCGEDLANSSENLKITNERTNKSKKADSMDKFIDRKGDEYTEDQKATMRKLDKNARESIDHKLFVSYYTSPKFLGETALAAGKVGLKMGARQAMGLILAEVWFTVKEEFQKIQDRFDPKELFCAIKSGVEQGFINAKMKFKTIIDRFFSGALAGALSSVSTTLCNIFLTTSKNIVTVIRQTWASLVEAIKILIFNPDNLLLGDRIKAAVKVLAVGASVVFGTMISEVISKSSVSVIPFVGDILPTFFATLSTGILSCTLLLILDRSSIVQGLVDFLNYLSSDNVKTVDGVIDFYKEQAQQLEYLAAKLQQIDIDSFKKETNMFGEIALQLSEADQSEESLNTYLLTMYKKYNISLPWQGNFDDFMSNKCNRLVFE